MVKPNVNTDALNKFHIENLATPGDDLVTHRLRTNGFIVLVVRRSLSNIGKICKKTWRRGVLSQRSCSDVINKIKKNDMKLHQCVQSGIDTARNLHLRAD